MSVTFRDATEKDVRAFVELLKDDQIGAARETAAMDVYLDVFRRVQADPMAVIVVGVLEDRIVAGYQLNAIEGLSLNGLRRGQIEDVRVASDLRGQGIGKLLMEDAFERARGLGCAAMQLVAHKDREATESFYRGVGFSVSHNGFKRGLN